MHPFHGFGFGDVKYPVDAECDLGVSNAVVVGGPLVLLGHKNQGSTAA